MPRCEDYPCCGHGPPPWGDGGGCPDSEGRFQCVLCGSLMDSGARSAICGSCQSDPVKMGYADEPGFDPGPGSDD
jgi:hypothetical protein